MARVENILVTNDDGISAPGLEVAIAIAEQLANDVRVVAPAAEQSGKSHSISLTTPMRVIKDGAHRYAVTGTPADCVMLALRELMPDFKPDLVISGVNQGQNLAQDVHYSGTVAGAREACLSGVRGVALSQAIDLRGDKWTIDFAPARDYGAQVLATILDMEWQDGCFYNVNFPPYPDADKCETRLTAQGARDTTLLQFMAQRDPQDLPYYWYRFDRQMANPRHNTDLEAIYAGHISITPLAGDATHGGFLDRLGKLEG